MLMAKLTDPAARIYYLRATAQFGWSRNVLLNQIKAGAYERAVTEKKTHNFPLAMPEYLAEQADEMLKSSYNLEFLGLKRAVKEREFEDRLVSRLQAFLLELGYGFCFVGRQYRLALGEKEYFIDLLFYHRFLKALVAFDLKVGAFEPEHAGKMDFYLNLLNDKERGPEDQPSIGIILCAEKDDVEVEYALRTKANPIGVAVYELQSKLPGELKGKLPTAKQLADVVRVEMEEGQMNGTAKIVEAGDRPRMDRHSNEVVRSSDKTAMRLRVQLARILNVNYSRHLDRRHRTAALEDGHRGHETFNLGHGDVICRPKLNGRVHGKVPGELGLFHRLNVVQPLRSSSHRNLLTIHPGGRGIRQYFEATRERRRLAGHRDKDFQSLNVPLPPLPEQQRIAAYLDASCAAIDAAVAAKRRQLETLGSSQTIIQQRFTAG